jgi:hypothetical protein
LEVFLYTGAGGLLLSSKKIISSLESGKPARMEENKK